jgi:hypothetical protein
VELPERIGFGENQKSGWHPWGRGEAPLPLAKGLTDWKAGCGKVARPVSRGKVQSLAPIHPGANSF